jgi:hypothetical protein
MIGSMQGMRLVGWRRRLFRVQERAGECRCYEWNVNELPTKF